MFVATEAESSKITFDLLEEGQVFNFNDSNVTNPDEMDTCLIFYDWLANSATSLHVCNRCETFIMFHPLTDTTVSGVGDIKDKATGWGTVELILMCNGHQYVLQLMDVLYIPTNHNSLIFLRRWDRAGGWYI